MTNKKKNNPERYTPEEAVEEALKMRKELGEKKEASYKKTYKPEEYKEAERRVEEKKEEKPELIPEQQKIYDQFLTKYKDMTEVVAGKTMEIKGERYRVPEKNMNIFVIVDKGAGQIDMAIGRPGEHATLFRKLKAEREKGLRGSYGAGEIIIYSSSIKKDFNENILVALEASLKKFNKDVELRRKDISLGEQAAREVLIKAELDEWKRRTGD